MSKLGYHGNINADVHATVTLKWSQINFRKVTRFGGPNLKAFDVVQLLSKWGEAAPPPLPPRVCRVNYIVRMTRGPLDICSKKQLQL